jgi:hypothetical protein
MKVCTCKLHQKGEIDGGLGGLLAGGLLHVAFLAGVSILLSPFLGLVYVFFLLTVSSYHRQQFVNKGHSLSCATRHGFIKVLDLGTYISPF